MTLTSNDNTKHSHSENGYVNYSALWFMDVWSWTFALTKTIKHNHKIRDTERNSTFAQI